MAPPSPPDTMLAAVITAPREVRAVRRPIPLPAADEVLLRVRAAGICGTDVAVFLGSYPAALPRIMGHEFSGEVAGFGGAVTDLAPGQAAVGEGSWTTDAGGAPVTHRLGRSVDGCFAEFVVVPRRALHPLPPTIAHLEAQSITTLATAIRAAKRAGTLRGRAVAIVGPGHAGLLLLQVCALQGPASLTVLGTRPGRLAVARRLGAGATVDVREPGFAAWKASHEGPPFDVVFEASGTAAGLADAFEIVRSNGTVVCYGIIPGDLRGVPGGVLYGKELNVLGSRGGDGEYPEAVRLLADRRVRVEPVVTHVLPLQRVEEGFALILSQRDTAIRVVLDTEPGAPSRHA